MFSGETQLLLPAKTVLESSMIKELLVPQKIHIHAFQRIRKMLQSILLYYKTSTKTRDLGDSCRRTVTDVRTMIIKDLNSNSSTSWGLLSIHSFFLFFLENCSTVCCTALHQFWLQSLVTRSQLDICCFSTTSNHVLTKGIVCSSYKFFTVRSPLSHTGSHQVLLLASRPSSLWCSSAHT